MSKAEKIVALVAHAVAPDYKIADVLKRHAKAHSFFGYDWDEYTMADGSIVRWDDSGFTVAAC